MTAPLFALLYAPNDDKADVLGAFAAARAADGVAVDGVIIETLWLDPRTKGGLEARALGSDRRLPLTRPFTDGIVVGRWHLLPDGVATMAGIVTAAAAGRCDLLIVDKFGPLEGRGEGMSAALAAALATDIALIVAVRREFAPAWRSFVATHAGARLSAMREAETSRQALEDWWADVGKRHVVSGLSGRD